MSRPPWRARGSYLLLLLILLNLFLGLEAAQSPRIKLKRVQHDLPAGANLRRRSIAPPPSVSLPEQYRQRPRAPPQARKARSAPRTGVTSALYQSAGPTSKSSHSDTKYKYRREDGTSSASTSASTSASASASTSMSVSASASASNSSGTGSSSSVGSGSSASTSVSALASDSMSVSASLSTSSQSNSASASATSGSSSASDSGSMTSTSYVATHTTAPLDSKTANGVAYVLTVQINGVDTPVVADTGSARLWVPSTSCDTCKSAGMVQPVTIDDPNNCQSGSIAYGLGTVEGCYTVASITIGDLRLDNVTVLAATSIDQNLQNQGYFQSGILGVGLEAGATDPDVPPVFKQMYDQGMLDQPLVGFWLSTDVSVESELALGSVDDDSHLDASTKVTVTHVDDSSDSSYVPAWYTVKTDSMIIGSTILAAEFISIMDTGTTAFYVPTNYLLPFYAAFNAGYIYWVTDDQGYESYVLQCNSTNTPVSMTFNGVTFQIPYEDLVGDELETGWCSGMVASIDNFDYVLVGDLFLKNVYSVYDVVSGDVTLYKLKDGTT